MIHINIPKKEKTETLQKRYKFRFEDESESHLKARSLPEAVFRMAAHRISRNKTLKVMWYGEWDGRRYVQMNDENYFILDIHNGEIEKLKQQ